ncbi:uncharacterized protein PV07_02104 [Cladophialophora immunda]|uniref:Uncharacterized protein n=1 Tax=Cladophialophora immunda TaxID=569365 RepID=A0A0D2A4X2_9EURO|nr:uncharacterized protein PV07_02104 [Cladophialophora immunda]KIW35406.1 hypothetical protein PV07_02104 [Cladophialophora immunda]
MRTCLVSALLGAVFADIVLADQPGPLGQWMGGGDCPWGSRTASGSHPQNDMPDTGVTRYYDFTVARGTYAPDGVQQAMIVVNGQYPGPLIEANWGDWIEVNVHNQIYGPEEPTSIHWHGLNQPGTPYYDGVVTVAQCPIVPGGNLTYRFRADEFGTSWWHAHYSAQYSAGVVGPIVVHGPNDAGYDVDLYPILVSDWFHDTYEDIVNLVMSPSSSGQPFRPFSDSNLVAGIGQYPCANVTNGAPCSVVPYASWEFESGKTYRLRFVNTGASAFETISIDGHQLTVIANDFVAVQPYQTEFVTIGVGQRVDVLVTANQAPGNYWLRAFNSPCGDTNGPYGQGIIYYTGSDPSTPPTSTGAQPPLNSNCQNDPLATTVPQYVMPVANPDTTITITIAGAPDASGVFHWTMNGVSYDGDLSSSLLAEAISGQTEFAPQYNVYNTGTNGTVRIIIINTTPAPHPMHIHGHDFQVLAEGFGTWDGTVTNPSNPQRRDVHMLWAQATPDNPSYIVVQYTQDNAGVWPLHCHIAWHLSAGMVIMLLEHPEQLTALQVPDSVAQTCPAYTTWYAANPGVVVDDSLRKRSLGEKMVEYMKGGVEHIQHLDKHRKRGVRGYRGYGHNATAEDFPNHGKFKGNATHSGHGHGTGTASSDSSWASHHSTHSSSHTGKATHTPSWSTRPHTGTVGKNLAHESKSTGRPGRKRDEV